jgi:hypothetical protein
MKIIKLMVIISVLFFLVAQANAQTSGFTIKFDEYGTAYVDVGNTGNFVYESGAMVFDSALGANALTYQLPAYANSGDLGVLDVTGATSDGLRFYSITDGATEYYMTFYSVNDGSGAPADTGLPTNFSFTQSVTEDSSGNFTLLYGTNSNNYYGYSDTSLPVSAPEPTTMLLVGLGLVGLAGVRRKFKQ